MYAHTRKVSISSAYFMNYLQSNHVLHKFIGANYIVPSKFLTKDLRMDGFFSINFPNECEGPVMLQIKFFALQKEQEKSHRILACLIEVLNSSRMSLHSISLSIVSFAHTGLETNLLSQ